MPQYDLYEVLGVARNATQDEIKKAFRSAAMKAHPDRNPGKAAEARMKALSEAYTLLSDPQKRAAYDRLGGRPQPQPFDYAASGDDFFGDLHNMQDELHRQAEARRNAGQKGAQARTTSMKWEAKDLSSPTRAYLFKVFGSDNAKAFSLIAALGVTGLTRNASPATIAGGDIAFAAAYGFCLLVTMRPAMRLVTKATLPLSFMAGLAISLWLSEKQSERLANNQKLGMRGTKTFRSTMVILSAAATLYAGETLARHVVAPMAASWFEPARNTPVP